MMRLLNKLLNIRTREWPRLLILYAMLFVVMLGLTWGETILEAEFLKQVGVEALPLFFIIKSLVSIPVVAIYTAFADRTANNKLLIAILMVSVTSILIGLGLLGLGLTKIAYPLLYLIIFVPLEDVFFTHWYTYINGFYDTLSAKRIIPVLGTAGRLAGITAGLTMPVLNSFLFPSQIVVMWLGTLLTMALLAWLMPYLLKEAKKPITFQPGKMPARASAPSLQLRPYLDNLREGYHYVAQSLYLRWMAVSTLILMLLFTFLQYQTSQILLDELQTTQNIANFIGRLTGITNMIILPFQLFGLSRIIGRVGLGNASLIFPTATLAISGGLIFWRGLGSAAMAYFNRTNFYAAIGFPIESLLYNAVPLRVKGRARAFIGGLVVPIGSLIGGGLLLLLPFIAVTWFVPLLIGVFAVAFMLSALVIRREYGRALITMLEQEDFSFLLSQESTNLSVADPATLNSLRQKLEQSQSYEFTIFMAKLISQLGGQEAVPILGQVARAAPDARVRAAILDVLAAADVQNEAIRQLYTDFLTDPDGRVRQIAIAGLERLAGFNDQQFRSLILGMVSDPDIEVRVRILSALVDSNGGPGNFYELSSAVELLNQLLAAQDSYQRARGVQVLGKINEARAVRRLVDYLADPADEVRLEAALALETLSRHKLSLPITALIIEKVHPLLNDPIERVRQAALTILGYLGTQESYQAITGVLKDSSSQIRESAADALVQAGKSVIPFIHPQLDSPDPQLRKMATIILSRVNQKEFGPLVGVQITGSLLIIYQNLGRIVALSPYNHYASIAVLQSALREQNEQLINDIFYLLSAIHDPNAVKIIAESLRNESAHVRANATEALESLTSPQTTQLIAPLFEPELDTTRLLHFSQDTWDMKHPDTAAAIQQLLTHPDNPWLKALMIFTLGEIGASLSLKTVRPTEQPISTSAAGHQVSSPNPLDILADQESSTDKNRGAPPEKRRADRIRSTDLLSALANPDDNRDQPSNSSLPSEQGVFTLSQIETVIEAALIDPVVDVRLAAQAARRMIMGQQTTNLVEQEGILLSVIEKIIFLKEVPFFQGMTVDQLKVLASVCEEELFEEDTRIFNQDDPGGALYVVVSGRVGIEQEKRKGSFARLATIEAHSYFGEMNLFDNSPHSDTAIALQDTLVLRLRREPLIALARQHPDLSLELINVLSARLRTANDRIAELTRTRTRKLQKFYDEFD